MRTYETVFVLNPELSTEAAAEQIEFYKDLITSNGGELVSVEPWGKLALAYKIEKFTEGYYALIQFKATSEYVAELEKRYKFNENVLRFVIVMIDEKKFKLKPRKDTRKERKPRYVEEQPDVDFAEDEEKAAEETDVDFEAEEVSEESEQE